MTKFTVAEVGEAKGKCSGTAMVAKVFFSEQTEDVDYSIVMIYRCTSSPRGLLASNLSTTPRK